MRHRNGKGLTFAIDAKINTFVEEWRRAKEYYPSLREISENFDPPRSVGLVHHHLRRLAAAGRLSQEAMQVYDSKNYAQKTKQENIKNERTKKSRKTGK